MIKHLLFVILASTIRAQAASEPEEDDFEEGGRVIILERENWQREVMKGTGGHTADIFVYFQDEHCRECRRGAT
jgi:hypothetical protein